MKEDETLIFMTRSFWLEMQIPQSIVKKRYSHYFGSEKCCLEKRDEAINVLSRIVNDIQTDMIKKINTINTSHVIKQLYKILDECHHFYMRQKRERKKMRKYNVDSDRIGDAFGLNRNMSRDVIDATNLWIENCVLLQSVSDRDYKDDSFELDYEMFIDMSIYGASSRALSLLTLSKKFKDNEMFYGIEIAQNDVSPFELLRYHPIIYFNTMLTGNQNILTSDNDLALAQRTDFGIGFEDEYGVGFLVFLALISYFQKYELADGRYAYTVMDEEAFRVKVESCTTPQIKSEIILKEFTLTKSCLSSQLRKKDPILWVMGTNKYRQEIRPFLQLENGRIHISYCALEQAKQIWTSYFFNGGMCYTNAKDKLTEAIEKRNDDLSNKLVDLIREKLRNHYNASFDEIDVKYTRIYGIREINYGDFDLVFYSKTVNELFLIEAKFFSDSLNSSGIISDFEKLFVVDGYYDRCRRRFDLVMTEPQPMKQFISAQGDVHVHYLFVSSKPLEIEFQDDDRVVTFLSLDIFDKYLEGKLISDEDDSVVRPIRLL